MKKSKQKKPSSNYLSFSLIVLVGIFIFAVGIYVLRNLMVPKINVVDVQPYGHTSMQGTLLKVTQVGIPGPYLLVNLTGNSVELQVPSNLDKLIGQPVKIDGELVPPKKSGGRQILIVSSIELN